MALATFNDLKTAIATELGRTDLTSVIPDLILRCEAKLRRRLHTLDMETKTTSFSIDGEYVNVPTGFMGVKSFQTTYGGNRYPIKPMPEEQQTDHYVTTGPPLFYSVVGSQFRFSPAPDATYPATLVYDTKLVGLATTSPNWILTDYPDAYLYGSLAEAEAYLSNDPRILVWKTGFDQCIAEINNMDKRKRWSGPALQIRPG